MFEMINLLIGRVFCLCFDRPFYKYTLEKCGAEFKLGPKSNINRPANFTIGNGFFTGPYCYMSTSETAKVKIGDYVMFGPNVTLLGGNHNVELSETCMRKLPSRPELDVGITIESDVWIGAGAIILDGAYISEGCVIAAGAVVNKRTEPYAVYGGVPAKLLKYRVKNS